MCGPSSAPQSFFAFWQKPNANIFAPKLNSIFFPSWKVEFEINLNFLVYFYRTIKYWNCRLSWNQLLNYISQTFTDFKNNLFVKLDLYSQFPKIPKVHKTQLGTYVLTTLSISQKCTSRGLCKPSYPFCYRCHESKHL